MKKAIHCQAVAQTAEVDAIAVIAEVVAALGIDVPVLAIEAVSTDHPAGTDHPADTDHPDDERPGGYLLRLYGGAMVVWPPHGVSAGTDHPGRRRSPCACKAAS
jgi:hypothetical protein